MLPSSRGWGHHSHKVETELEPTILYDPNALYEDPQVSTFLYPLPVVCGHGDRIPGPRDLEGRGHGGCGRPHFWVPAPFRGQALGLRLPPSQLSLPSQLGERGIPQETAACHRRETPGAGARHPDPQGGPRLQPHLGNVIVCLHDALGVEILGTDQAQPQAQQEQRHALQWVGTQPACCPPPLSPSLRCGFRLQLFCVLRTGLRLMGALPKAAPVLCRRRLALTAAQMGARLGLKSQRDTGTGWCLGLKPRRPQGWVALGPL